MLFVIIIPLLHYLIIFVFIIFYFELFILQIFFYPVAVYYKIEDSYLLETEFL